MTSAHGIPPTLNHRYILFPLVLMNTSNILRPLFLSLDVLLGVPIEAVLLHRVPIFFQILLWLQKPLPQCAPENPGQPASAQLSVLFVQCKQEDSGDACKNIPHFKSIPAESWESTCFCFGKQYRTGEQTRKTNVFLQEMQISRRTLQCGQKAYL